SAERAGVLGGLAVGVLPDGDEHALLSPLDSLFVGGEEEVEAAALDGAAAVEDGDDRGAGVAGDAEHGAVREDRGVRGHETTVVGLDRVEGGGKTVGAVAAGGGVGG